jgi:drug/metabolite transporter (DMT)-like permease
VSDDSDDDDQSPRSQAPPPPAQPAQSDLAARSKLVWLEVLAFAAIYLIWGSTYMAIRVGVRSLPPFLMAGCRFVIAGGILYAIMRARGVRAPTLAQWGRAAVAGLLMLTAANGLVTWAEIHIASNLAALFIAAVPLYVALLDWLRPGGVAPKRRVWIGIGVGAAGMALLVMRDGSSGAPAAPNSAAAVAALLLSGLCWAAGSLYSRYGAMHPHPLMAAAQQMLAGGVAQLLLSLASGEPGRLSLASLSTQSLLAFAYLTLAGSLVAFTAFGWLVKASTPARLSTNAYVNPVVAVVLGWLLLGEQLAPRALAGAGLIVCAVVVMTVSLPSRRRTL